MWIIFNIAIITIFSLLLAILLQIIVNTMIIGKPTHRDGRYHDSDDDEDNDNDNDDDEVSCKLYFVKTGFGRSRDKSRHISPTVLTIVSHSWLS